LFSENPNARASEDGGTAASGLESCTVEVLGVVLLVTAIIAVLWALLFFGGSNKDRE
jgi:hypothetical protein